MQEGILQRVKSASKVKQISIAELERKMGVGSNSIYKWKTQQPKLDKIKKVSEILEVSTDYLIYGDSKEVAENE